MVLFSSLNHFNALLLFVYLGLLSGIIFYPFYYLTKFLDRPLKLKNKNFKKEILNRQKNKNKLEAFFSTIKNGLLIFFKKAFRVILKIACLIMFCLLIVFSYFCNLKYNFGCASIYYVLIWCGAFFAGVVFIKIVANFLINFYNKFIKKV